MHMNETILNIHIFAHIYLNRYTWSNGMINVYNTCSPTLLHNKPKHVQLLTRRTNNYFTSLFQNVRLGVIMISLWARIFRVYAFCLSIYPSFHLQASTYLQYLYLTLPASIYIYTSITLTPSALSLSLSLSTISRYLYIRPINLRFALQKP